MVCLLQKSLWMKFNNAVFTWKTNVNSGKPVPTSISVLYNGATGSNALSNWMASRSFNNWWTLIPALASKKWLNLYRSVYAQVRKTHSEHNGKINVRSAVNVVWLLSIFGLRFQEIFWLWFYLVETPFNMRELALVYRSSQKLGFFKELLQCDGHAERSSGKVLSLFEHAWWASFCYEDLKVRRSPSLSQARHNPMHRQSIYSTWKSTAILLESICMIV